MIKDNILNIQNELPSGVQLVAVSKYHPVEAVFEAYEAGQRVFAESRPQELVSKVEAVRQWMESKGYTEPVEWHFIGHLQTNKLKMVLPYATLVQSVDSLHLLQEIDKWGAQNSKVIDVLLELHIAAEDSKQGFYEEEVLEIMLERNFKNVRIRGLMGMATNTDDEAVVESDFQRIDSFMAYLVDLVGDDHPDFNQLSIGMSGDWKIAVRNGATIVRIGSSIFAAPES